MRTLFKDKNVLITGGAGTVGSEIARKLLDCDVAVVRIFDNSESGLFFLREKLGKHDNLRFLLGDVRDKERLARAIENIDFVFHTAALKHVHECEYNPFEAVKTNILGTQNLIDVAIEEEVDKVVFTSSDKAVNPCSVMGVSKLMTEKLITAANYYKGSRRTVIYSVRFGNVLGSSGSVIPLFNQQIRDGGPVTVTNHEMTRFIMPLSQAIELIFKTIKLAKGGEVFVLKMPVMRLVDLVEVMIEELAPKYGYKPEEIEVKVIGRKPGEKMYEELMTEDESTRALETETLFIILPQIQESQQIDYSYQGAKQICASSYTSHNVEPLSKTQLKDMLHKEELI